MTIADPSDVPGGKTIEQRLAECADPFTVEDYDRELAVHEAIYRILAALTANGSANRFANDTLD